MNKSSQRGSAIIMLFIAVALFGMLAYAFMQGSRTSTSWLEKEQDSAAATGSLDCTNTVNMAVKRLEARGCGSNISYIADGSNSAPGAPTDGSCSVFHPNGGGVKSCGLMAVAPSCSSGDPIGTVCPDGTIYAGITPDGNKMMAIVPSDMADPPWNDGDGDSNNHIQTNLNSTTTGQANTLSLATGGSNQDSSIQPGTQPHMAANLCSDLQVNGHSDWYLPAIAELNVLYDNRALISGLKVIGGYSSSTERSRSEFYVMNFEYGTWSWSTKPGGSDIRCARKIN
jgi:hypothetical protein